MRADKVEVVVDHDSLKRERWEFWLRLDHGGGKLMLDDYRLETRENTRKRTWKAQKVYSRTGDTRRLPMGVKMEASDVTIPDHIAEEAKRQICNAINAMEIERSDR